MALCLCRRQCSVICSRIARHEQGRSPCGHPQQIRWRRIQRHDPKSIRGEWQFSCSWIPLFHAEVVSRAWKKDCNSLQKCSIPEAGQLRGRGQRQRRGREATGNAAQSPEHWIQSLAAGHGYMYILRKFNCMFFSSFLGLLINHLRVEETPGHVILQDCCSKVLRQEVTWKSINEISPS